MQAPVVVVRPQIADPVVDEMRGIGDHKIPAFGRRNIPQPIGAKDRYPRAEPVISHGSPARFHRFRVGVGEAERLGHAARQQ
jgi:hypothetical protein